MPDIVSETLTCGRYGRKPFEVSYWQSLWIHPSLLGKVQSHDRIRLRPVSRRHMGRARMSVSRRGLRDSMAWA